MTGEITCGQCVYWDEDAEDAEDVGRCTADRWYHAETAIDESPTWCPGAKLVELRTKRVDISK